MAAEKLNDRPTRPLPTRSQQLQNLSSENYDVLVIGGGATGAGCALDSVSRGLKTALVEMDDFSSGTSSRYVNTVQYSILICGCAHSPSLILIYIINLCDIVHTFLSAYSLPFFNL